jgi:argininosuccinate lyase
MSNSDDEKFPARVYKDTVLAPLFEGVKRHHWRYQMRINQASAVLLAECALLTKDEARLILKALDDILETIDLDRLVYTGEHEDFFFHVEAELIRRLGVEVAGKLHTGRSRNDIDHTVFKLALKDRLAALFTEHAAMIDALLAVAERERETIVVAYTHGQPAQPTTYGHYLAAFIELSLRDMERLLHAARTVDLCSMGAAAITTSGFGLDRKRMADLLGFAEVQENSYGCIAATDYVTGVYAAIKLIFIHAGRFVQDLNTWTGFEIGHLRVPDAFVQISSIMPQKRNPVPVEHLRLMASLGAARCEAVLMAIHNTPFTDMNDSEGEVQIAGYEAFDTGHRFMALLGGLLAAVTIDGAKVRRHIDEAGVTLAELADSLVRTEAISFRQAHEVASKLARRMIDGGMTLSRVPFTEFQEIFAAAIGRPARLGEADFRRFTTPEHFIAVRNMRGGPAPAPLAASFVRYRGEIAAKRAAIDEFAGRKRAAEDMLAREVTRRIAGG